MHTSAKLYLYCLLVLLYVHHSSKAQRVLFAEGFESNTLTEAWQRVTGNWHIADVQDMRIAPAEDGRQYVLSSGGPGYLYLAVDIPDSVKASQVKLSFSYYTYSKGPAPVIELDFHKKNWKDGHKGKKWKTVLPIKGRWFSFSKVLKIPAEANMVWLTFYEAPSRSNTKVVCFDNIVISSLP